MISFLRPLKELATQMQILKMQSGAVQQASATSSQLLVFAQETKHSSSKSSNANGISLLLVVLTIQGKTIWYIYLLQGMDRTHCFSEDAKAFS